MVYIQKRLNWASFKADLWHGENIDRAQEKNPQNSNVEWDPVNGEIELLKKNNIVFFAIFPNFAKGI